MSEHQGWCGVVALDHTLGGLGTLVGSDTQLPPGWTGARPGEHGERLCPSCTQRAAEDEKDGGGT